jgi:hypothetical protein
MIALEMLTGLRAHTIAVPLPNFRTVDNSNFYRTELPQWRNTDPKARPSFPEIEDRFRKRVEPQGTLIIDFNLPLSATTARYN